MPYYGRAIVPWSSRSATYPAKKVPLRLGLTCIPFTASRRLTAWGVGGCFLEVSLLSGAGAPAVRAETSPLLGHLGRSPLKTA